MPHATPTFQDADLTIRLYELRRDEVMRRSRDAINGKFWPRSYEELIAITRPEHEWNAAWRQVSSYWEMVYGMARHGIAHPEYLMENNAEGLFLFAKVKPHLERYRKEISALAFLNAEWIATSTDQGRRRLELFEKRVKTRLEAK